MQTLQAGYRGLSFLVGLNRDGLLFLGTLALGLAAGALFASWLFGL